MTDESGAAGGDLFGIAKAIERSGIPAAVDAARELLLKLVGPAAEEAGLVLQDRVHEYRLKNQLRALGRMQEVLRERGVAPKAVAAPAARPSPGGGSLGGRAHPRRDVGAAARDGRVRRPHLSRVRGDPEATRPIGCRVVAGGQRVRSRRATGRGRPLRQRARGPHRQGGRGATLRRWPRTTWPVWASWRSTTSPWPIPAEGCASSVGQSRRTILTCASGSLASVARSFGRSE